MFLITAGSLLVAGLSSLNVVEANQELRSFWRTTYDILVRPAGSRSAIEQEYRLVEANYLAGIAGGITFEQYQAIKDIPGVAVAAPIAMLGYLPFEFEPPEIPALELGLYLIETSIVVDRGGYKIENINKTYAYYGNLPEDLPDGTSRKISFNTPIRAGYQPIPMLLAAIDPAQEEQLIGLEQAMLEGQYLSGKEKISSRVTESPFGTQTTNILDAPIIINSTPYVNFTSTHRIGQLLAATDDIDLERILSSDGLKYLESLPTRENVFEKTLSSAEAYSQLIRSLRSDKTTGFVRFWGLPKNWQPFPRQVQVIENSLSASGIVLRQVTPKRWEGILPDPNALSFTLKTVGVFDMSKLPLPTDPNRVPLETYYPPEAVLKYDPNGLSVAPQPLLPSLWPEDNISSPPLLLTTMEAARAITGESCISAVRIRVGGDLALSEESQKEIEAIATEIRRRTGLDVDIMVGSSPTSVLVEIPGVGYVDEGWIQKNVVLDYQKKIQSGHLLLIIGLIGLGGIFIFDLSLEDMLSNSKIITIQKMVGWGNSKIMGSISFRLVLITLVSLGVGTGFYYGISQLFKLPLLPVSLVVSIIFMIFLSIFVGCLFPILKTRKISLISQYHLQATDSPQANHRIINTSLQYIIFNLNRRRQHTAISLLSSSLSSSLLVLLLMVTYDQRGFLAGSILGNYIAGNIAPYHYALIGIGFCLTSLSLMNSLVFGLLERRREVGMLKAAGWTNEQVASLFLGEGLIIGFSGGMIGSLLALAAFLGLYGRVSPSNYWVLAVGILMTAFVGLFAASYPAWVAARVNPSDSLRME